MKEQGIDFIDCSSGAVVPANIDVLSRLQVQYAKHIKEHSLTLQLVQLDWLRRSTSRSKFLIITKQINFHSDVNSFAIRIFRAAAMSTWLWLQNFTNYKRAPEKFHTINNIPRSHSSRFYLFYRCKFHLNYKYGTRSSRSAVIYNPFRHIFSWNWLIFLKAPWR